MKVILLQTDIEWAEPGRNVRRAEGLMDRHPDGDLYVLPEMFSTGFCTQPEGIAEPAAGSVTLAWMKHQAQERQCAIAGSIAIEDEGRFFNRFHFVYPDGKTVCYDKRHLFTYGGEDRQYTPGTERVVVDYRGVRILLQICYDLRFPVFARNRNDYDMMVYIASWPVARIDAWKTLIRARALENQCYVAAVNRIGSDPYCRYNGGTALIDPYGRTLAACPDDEEGAAIAEINVQALAAFRKKFPVLDDADMFTLD